MDLRSQNMCSLADWQTDVWSSRSDNRMIHTMVCSDATSSRVAKTWSGENSRGNQLTFNIQSLADLTATQGLGLYDVLNDVKNAKSWSWELPVLLRDRCWLRLDRIQLSQLMRQLPPQGHEEAPELVRYRLLIEEGFEPLTAQQTCWQALQPKSCEFVPIQQCTCKN